MVPNSSGVLAACAPEAVDAVLSAFAAPDSGDAAMDGAPTAGEARISVR